MLKINFKTYESLLFLFLTDVTVLRFWICRETGLLFWVFHTQLTTPFHSDLGLDLPEVKQKEKQKEVITYERTKAGSRSNHKGRLPFPEHLPRLDEMVEPKEDVNHVTKIGEEITSQLCFNNLPGEKRGIPGYTVTANWAKNL